ncbi:hypothetical protein EV646_104548 [Kribbella antiqua]|uniref:Uncharacterized protein n=1 Tax=Kribbella antiqua TaxID=2512217 RepID=A0A4R2IWI1_9ACTN|nr:hypothetical protein [Kribbella antiqua]TCO48726.1 hypothetical protein EV646_104548 [Kribbella antiqua]
MAERFDLDAIDADDALLDLLAAGGESARTAGEHDPALKLLADLRLAVEVEDELPVETIDDPESFLARCAALNPVMDPFARKMATRGLALSVAAVAALSVSGVAAAVTGDPLSPYEKVIEKMVDAVSPRTSFPKEKLDGMPVVDKTKIVKVAKNYKTQQEEKAAAKEAEQAVVPPASVDGALKPPLARPLVVQKPALIEQPVTPVTTAPAEEPNKPADDPTTEPTADPTTEPTTEPSSEPTTEPSDPPATTPPPSSEPTSDPTTTDPTTDPTMTPTTQPSNGETGTESGETSTGTNTGKDSGTNTGETSTGETGAGSSTSADSGTGTGSNTSADSETAPSSNPTTVPSADSGSGSETSADPSSDSGSADSGQAEETQPAEEPANPLGDLVDKVLEPVLPTPTGEPVEVPSAEEFFGSTAKHSSGKVSTGSVKTTYPTGKHSSGQYAEGKHAAIDRTHGSTESPALLQILDVVNSPTN